MVKVKNQSSPRLSRSPSRKSSLRAGSLVKVNEQDVALFRYGDVVYAISEHCPHAGGPLHVGDIEDVPGKSLCVRCPYHGWKFDLETGKCCHPKSRGDLSAIVYPVRVDPESGEMAVGFDQFNPFYFTGSSF
ncbi:Rieske domain-containing protein isoform X1 [Penaeus vannamei]|uniref:Putative Rieske domain-containing protein-like n=1 Tax=Penaeus vannamei TaxID=6689 RepID=A0A423TFD0_PENVA|nr:Rieske domain-containing protein-like isoform X3 [Penaeus vannamei]XP_027214474.1 Rieske domain-containing protein-like isoform X3 [Penaeus vannamei]ROT75077.1 putative Rieske domain-containing protein-like [Penaeus vannamei]